MRVGYHATGTPVYYICDARAVGHAEPLCQSLAGHNLEALVTEEVLRALEPARLELHEHVLADLERDRQRLDKHWQQRLERARIETDRAARQYHAHEPENRLVTRELERRWEKSLQEQREVEEEYDRFRAEKPRQLTAIDRRRIKELAKDIPALWRSRTTTIEDRQTIVRCLVERVTVAVRGETEWVDATIHWAGGSESRHEFKRPVQRYEQLSNYRLLRDHIVGLYRSGMTTAQVAERLNSEGFRPPNGVSSFNKDTVYAFLVRHGISGQEIRRRRHRDGLRRHEWRLKDLAGELGMPRDTLGGWLRRGWITGVKSAEVDGAWIIWADERELTRLRRLRAWKRGGYNLKRPAELITPPGSRSPVRNSANRGSRRSGRKASNSKRSTRD